MKKSILLFLLLSFCSLLLQAQSNFKPALLVTSTGDTLKGFVDYREWLRTPTEFTFKAEGVNASEQKFTPANTQHLQITGLETFQSAVIRMSMAPVDLNSNFRGSDTTTQVAAVFLNLITSGPRLSFFSYKDRIKTRFYIKESNKATPPHELKYRKYYAEGDANRTVTETLFRNQLWDIALQHHIPMEKFQRKAMAAKYTEKDILELVHLINGTEPALKTARYTEDLSRVRFLAGIWGARTSFTMVEHSGFGKEADYSTSYAPLVSVGLDVFANPITQKLLIRTELSYTQTKFNATGLTSAPGSRYSYHSNYKLSQRSISLNPQALYHLYNSPNFKFYVAGGVIGTFAQYSGDVIFKKDMRDGEEISSYKVENYLKPNKILVSYTARIGVVALKRLDFSALYTTFDITQQRQPFVTQTVAIGASYLISK